ncbi:hypothetical protein V8D89_001645 [Ganoderma adspersum]
MNSTTSLGELATPHTIEETYGALLLGTFFSLVLYGLILHQTYRYMRLHPHDYMYIQVLVALSLILETVHAVCTMHVNYYALVTNYFNPSALEHRLWSLNLFVLTGELCQITTYSFFIRRIYFISGRFQYAAVLAVLFLAVDTGFSLAITVRVFQFDNPEAFLNVVENKQSYFVHGKLAAATATHVVLTGSLIYALNLGQKFQKERKSVLAWCMLYVVNTGLLVSIFDIIAWILARALAGTAWWAALSLVTARLYMITFLSPELPQLLTKTGIEIFGSDSTTKRNFIVRAQRLATAERYNAPQTLIYTSMHDRLLLRWGHKLPERAPTRIDIKVATEIEEGDGDGVRTSHSSVIIEGGKMGRM